MQEQVEHKIFSSFREWFEHTLLAAGGFTNTSGKLYPHTDARVGTGTYSSPHYQWVYDQSISGASIPTASGVGVPHIDYINGRAIGGAPSPTGTFVSYAIKDFNIYTTTKSEEKLIFEEKYNTIPKPVSKPATGALAPYQIVAPCIFLIPEQVRVDEHCYGGGVEEKLTFKALIVADNEFDKYGVGTLFSKTKNVVFPYFDQTPLNVYGDFKTGGYNYVQQAQANNNPGRFVYIKDVSYSPLEDDVIKKAQPNLAFALLKFNCSFYTNLSRRTF
jgi:hypothetical protein